MTTYTCDECGGTFESARSEQDANQEALERWGVPSASTNPDMAQVCDECYDEIMLAMETDHGERVDPVRYKRRLG